VEEGSKLLKGGTEDKRGDGSKKTNKAKKRGLGKKGTAKKTPSVSAEKMRGEEGKR